MARTSVSRTRSSPDAAARALLERYAKASPRPVSESDTDPILGNADTLVSEWKKQLGEDADAMLLAFRIRRLGMVLDKISNSVCESFGLKSNEMHLIMALHRAGPPHALRPSQILKTHGVTSGTVTYRIDQLTKQGLAERLDDPTDRRGYLIQLTPRGKKVMETVLDRFTRTYNTLLLPFAGVVGGHDVLESGLRLFEACISDGADSAP